MNAETLNNLPRPELQRLAKANGVKANLKTSNIIEKLLAIPQASSPRPQAPSRPPAASPIPTAPIEPIHTIETSQASIAPSLPPHASTDAPVGGPPTNRQPQTSERRSLDPDTKAASHPVLTPTSVSPAATPEVMDRILQLALEITEKNKKQAASLPTLVAEAATLKDELECQRKSLLLARQNRHEILRGLVHMKWIPEALLLEEGVALDTSAGSFDSEDEGHGDDEDESEAMDEVPTMRNPDAFADLSDGTADDTTGAARKNSKHSASMDEDPLDEAVDNLEGDGSVHDEMTSDDEEYVPPPGDYTNLGVYVFGALQTAPSELHAEVNSEELQIEPVSSQMAVLPIAPVAPQSPEPNTSAAPGFQQWLESPEIDLDVHPPLTDAAPSLKRSRDEGEDEETDDQDVEWRPAKRVASGSGLLAGSSFPNVQVFHDEDEEIDELDRSDVDMMLTGGECDSSSDSAEQGRNAFSESPFAGAGNSSKGEAPTSPVASTSPTYHMTLS